ncbi:MAG: pyridoxine 5'-phosphate synthase [Bdellovibrionaceae bacterium]|jgi:pyridoxine 5-phosphate synthase|nr:pyridoxine 5'-phosphate synthase [Pseudobdellovibrionaceae bacterium]
MTKLSVNINKIATLRNARGQDTPNLVSVCRDIIKFGSQGVTIHPRPDERHITTQDVYDIHKLLIEVNSDMNKNDPGFIEFNIEGYPSAEFLSLVNDVHPEQVTLVPDPPHVLTSNAGWDFVENKKTLIDIKNKFNSMNCRVSLFLDPYTFNDQQALALQEIRPQRIEFYTEQFAKLYSNNKLTESVQMYQSASNKIQEMNIEINAGHDLSLENIKYLINNLPEIKEVSIGHALICESLYQGLDVTIKKYLYEIKEASKTND